MASLGAKFQKHLRGGGIHLVCPSRCSAFVLLANARFAHVRPKSGPVNKYLASNSQNPLAAVASAAHF